MATHSSILTWKIPWMEEPGRLQSMGSKELDMTKRLHFLFYLCIISATIPQSSSLRHRAFTALSGP